MLSSSADAFMVCTVFIGPSVYRNVENSISLSNRCCSSSLVISSSSPNCVGRAGISTVGLFKRVPYPGGAPADPWDAFPVVPPFCIVPFFSLLWIFFKTGSVISMMVGGFTWRCFTTSFTAVPSRILLSLHDSSDSNGGYPVIRIRESSHGCEARIPTKVIAGRLLGALVWASDAKYTRRISVLPDVVWNTVSCVLSSEETQREEGLRVGSLTNDSMCWDRVYSGGRMLPSTVWATATAPPLLPG
mmetsp:Transcript_24622/g.57367  ORF Transcript_24622/g.57367 Transcript_24622/m.57367 type:complete len:245 (-) Transcript_24622:46-780(-)